MKKTIILPALIVLLSAALFFVLIQSEEQDEFTDIGNITVEEVQAKMESGDSLLFLDVRNDEEFTGPLGHISGATLIPLFELENRVNELEAYRDHTIIVYCRSGNRSRYATRFLVETGYKAVNMLGGIIEWNKQK